MNLNKKSIILIGIFLISLIWIFLVIKTQQESQKEPAVVFVKIPPETIDFFKELFGRGSDVGVDYNPDPDPLNWADSTNIGEDPNLGYSKIWDENFIIYYSREGNEKEKAQKTLRYANWAIVPLKDLFGKYYYPKDVNQRRLAIYLTSKNSDYVKITQLLCRCTPPANSIGLTILELSKMGWLTKGIIIAPEPWNDSWDYARKVIWHEMAHYVYYTSLDASKIIKPYSWIIEGIAEYFCANQARLNEINPSKLKSIRLNHELQDYRDAYWVGYSVFTYMESDFKYRSIKQFLTISYSTNPVPHIPSVTKLSIPRFENQWKSYTIKLSK